jgi:hypothetical protein
LKTNPSKTMKTSVKIDLFVQHKDEYIAARKPTLVEIKPAGYLAISGQGAPGGDTFTDKIGALYGVAYTVKMTRKFAGLPDYAVSKLEARWWLDEGGADFSKAPKDQWQWQLLIRTPDFVTAADLDKAIATLLKRGKTAASQEVRIEPLSEGLCVQMLHVGPYDREGETIALMKTLADAKQLQFHGRHHEIYLSDPRRIPPERLKTILRLPVKSCRPKPSRVS